MDRSVDDVDDPDAKKPAARADSENDSQLDATCLPDSERSPSNAQTESVAHSRDTYASATGDATSDSSSYPSMNGVATAASKACFKDFNKDGEQVKQEAFNESPFDEIDELAAMKRAAYIGNGFRGVPASTSIGGSGTRTEPADIVSIEETMSGVDCGVSCPLGAVLSDMTAEASAVNEQVDVNTTTAPSALLVPEPSRNSGETVAEIVGFEDDFHPSERCDAVATIEDLAHPGVHVPAESSLDAQILMMEQDGHLNDVHEVVAAPATVENDASAEVVGIEEDFHPGGEVDAVATMECLSLRQPQSAVVVDIQENLHRNETCGVATMPDNVSGVAQVVGEGTAPNSDMNAANAEVLDVQDAREKAVVSEDIIGAAQAEPLGRAVSVPSSEALSGSEQPSVTVVGEATVLESTPVLDLRNAASSFADVVKPEPGTPAAAVLPAQSTPTISDDFDYWPTKPTARLTEPEDNDDDEVPDGFPPPPIRTAFGTTQREISQLSNSSAGSDDRNSGSHSSNQRLNSVRVDWCILAFRPLSTSYLGCF